KAYELARHGEKPELRPRHVTVTRLDLTEWDDSDAARPVATMEIACSAGTYIRALARDLGDALGCGAYLGALTRTASGPFRLEQAHPLDAVRAALSSGRASELLLPMDAGLDFPEVQLSAAELTHLARGQQLRHASPADGSIIVRVLDPSGRLVAIARAENGVLQPEKVFRA
ncbi:MAG TPA: tRNA pseudouridine(55) synthase TruB, partial [Candidatus Limnocylindrales bacterium]